MKTKHLVLAAFLVCPLGLGPVWAENDGLAVTQTVPTGERVANYLQNYLGTIYTVVEAKNSGGSSRDRKLIVWW